MPRHNGLLTKDPTVSIAYHRPDDRFVPVHRTELAAAMGGEPDRFGAQASQFVEVADAIAKALERDAHEFERALCCRYEAVNPDRDTIPPSDPDAERTPGCYAEIATGLEYLLAKANFAQLGEADMQAALHAANTHGLRVRLRPDRIQSLSVWVRGCATVDLKRLSWRHPFSGRMQTMPVYRRLVVVARLKNDPNVVLKLFKEIPVADIEALLPHAEVRMGLLDRIKVMGGGAGMAGSTAAKIFNVVANFAYWSKMFWVLIIGGGVLAVRTLLGYRNARELRDSQRTRHLYYQNLDNNLGVIHSLVSMVAHEDTKETLLAYAVCAAGAIRDVAELRRRVEEFLFARFKLRVDFDVDDAIRTIGRLGLWRDPKKFHVAEPEAAIDRLTQHALPKPHAVLTDQVEGWQVLL